MLLGTDQSYPYINNPGAFPHSKFLKANKEKLDDHFIVLNDVAEIKKNPHNDFCILTLQTYVEYHSTISPLCLPENPNQFYDNFESEVGIYGYGYDSTFKQTLKNIAKMEKDQNKMLKSSRSMKLINTDVQSRKKCLNNFGSAGRKNLEGKAGHEDMELKV